MTHEDAGHYAAKHSGANVNPGIAANLKKKISGGCISCGAAHAAAQELKVTPGEVGVIIDLLEAHIVQCQLGLFGGHSQQPANGPSDDAVESVRQTIEAALVNGRLPCAAAWQIAESFPIPKSRIKDACDRLNIKICGCQLGAFT